MNNIFHESIDSADSAYVADRCGTTINYAVYRVDVMFRGRQPSCEGWENLYLLNSSKQHVLCKVQK